MLIIDHIWQDHVPTNTIQTGSFTHNVDAKDLIAVFSNFCQQVVSGETKRIVDI